MISLPSHTQTHTRAGTTAPTYVLTLACHPCTAVLPQRMLSSEFRARTFAGTFVLTPCIRYRSLASNLSHTYRRQIVSAHSLACTSVATQVSCDSQNMLCVCDELFCALCVAQPSKPTQRHHGRHCCHWIFLLRAPACRPRAGRGDHVSGLWR